MAVYPVLGTSPVSYIDSHEDQKEIPLNCLYFTPDGLDATLSPLYLIPSGPDAGPSPDQGMINALLQQLVAQGFLVASTQAVLQPTAKAALAGAMGNSITIQFTNSNSASGVVDVQVGTTQVYSGLTPSGVGTGTTIETAMGTTAATATGLVIVSDPGTGVMPAAFSGAPGAVPDTGAGTAFTLAAANAADAADAALIAVTIVEGTGSAAGTFTVTVAWSKKVTGLSVATLVTTNPFSYLVGFAGAATGPTPGNGSVTLSGGANATTAPVAPAVAASASIYAAA